MFLFLYFDRKSNKDIKQNSINKLRSQSIFQSPQYIAGIDQEGIVDSIGFPTGIILIWYPLDKTITSLSLLKTSVPDGWAICDGTNGTPDLRGRFVLMAQDSIPTQEPIPVGSSIHTIGSSGGNEKHILKIDEIPSHTHLGGSSGGIEVYNVRSNSNTANIALSNVSTSYTGGASPYNILPPYYTLVYLMHI